MQVTDAHKAFGSRKILQGVDLGIGVGELVGVVGENGAGKTTLLRILSGQLPLDRGDVVLSGSLGYCPQRAVLNDVLTVDQHLRLFQVSYGLHQLDLAYELVEQLGFGSYLSTPAGVLSGGTQQKLNLVIALMHDPMVVLLDEPYQGFDWETYLRFWDIVTTLRERGRAILVVSHLAYDIERLDALHRLRNGVLERTTVDSHR